MPTVDVLDSTMFHEEAGVGTPLVFLHGNPTSSYLWRHVLPRIGEPGRRLAPDLIGMGVQASPTSVSVRRSRSYLDAWFDKFGLDAAVLVGHDWGGALALDWAARHPERTRGVAFMETNRRAEGAGGGEALHVSLEGAHVLLELVRLRLHDCGILAARVNTLRGAR
jgi:haloalkane dehalogenase